MAVAGAPEAATYFSGPLQLIRIDDDGKCHLQENAVSILNQIQGKLAVAGVAGLYRTGKSFLLNRLLGLQEGFEIGPTVNPCTKGLWIWGQPVQLAPDFHCVFIDTEGLGSTQRSASCDMQIFSLCILLSSFFIYNSMGAIDEQAIDDLHLVAHLAKHIHVKTRSIPERESELGQYFPTFLWALRDFHLRLVDNQGNPISEKEYLENSLRSIPGQEEKNKVRDVIKDLFRDRDCVTIVRPVGEEADLRNIQRLSYESLRPQFRSQVEEFVRKVYTSLKPKKIDGAYVSGTMFVNLAFEYCKAINSSVVPTIQSAWSSVVQHQLRLCLKDAVQVYRSLMNDKAMQHLPMDEDKLRELHKAAKADAIKVFTSPKFESTDPKFREFRAELAARIKQLQDHVKTENLSTSKRQCERVAKELFGREIENKLGVRGAYQSFEQLQKDWDTLKNSYFAQTAGPSQADVLVTWIFPRMTESTQKLWEELRTSHEDRHATLQRKLAEAEAKPTDAHDALDNERNNQGELLELAKRQWLAEKFELERQLEDIKRTLEESIARANREKAQLVDSERAMREQMKLLQERAGFSAMEGRRQSNMSEGSALPTDFNSLRDAVMTMMTEVRGISTEKKQLEMKAEHEKQLIGLERKFQRQLTDARRKNEGLIEDLRQTYEDEVDKLKTQKTELISRGKDLEKELERYRGELELLQHRVSAAETEKTLQKRFVENAQKQSELIIASLQARSGKDSQVREELGSLSDAQQRTSPASISRGNSGALPYSAANAAVLRSVPGV